MHNTHILYYKRGNTILEIISYSAIIGLAITSHFAVASVLVFATFGASHLATFTPSLRLRFVMLTTSAITLFTACITTHY